MLCCALQYLDVVNRFREDWMKFREDRGRDAESLLKSIIGVVLWYNTMLYLVRT